MTPHQERETFETAIEHASRDVPVFPRASTAVEMLDALRRVRYESASHIVVCDGEKFAGLLRIEDLLASPPARTAAELMDAEAPVVAPGVDQEIAAWRALQHGESALAVVDAGGRFHGLIPPHRMLAILLAEHEEDLSRLGGFLRASASARHASEEPLGKRFVHRIPWLLLGLGGAVAAADIVGSFEAELRRNVTLSFFVAGVVYLADAVGTQTETVVVRGLSLGVPIRRIIKRELLTGLLIGLTLALISLPILAFRWGDWRISAGVSLSLAAACSTATVAAMLLPWLLDKLGFDPAFGSGPLATVVQDLLSIAIYFGIITAVVL